MPDYSLVPVDYQPDFGGYSLVPVDYDPFAADGLAQQAQIQQPPTPAQPAQPQPQPQQPATGAGQPGVTGPATGNSPSGSGGGAGVGNAGIGPSNTTWAQGGAPAFTPLDGYANPTPTESLVNQAQKESKKVQVDLVTADSSADRGSSDIHQKIVDRASVQIGSGDWHFNVAKGNFGPNKDKCNLFVYDMLTDAGASPGLPNGHWWNPYPPTAENWADPSFAIPGWRVLGSGESPQPGDVVGQRIQWENGATGHVMIVGPNATFIGVGTSEKIESVAPKTMGGIYPDPKTRPGGLLVYRRYEH